MCLAVPGRIVGTEEIGSNRIGQIEFGGVTRAAFLDFVPQAEVGDYVLVHVGFAISRIDAEEAERTYGLLEKLGLLGDEGLAPPAPTDPQRTSP